ncbi:MAG: fructose bisphosphate aldolase [Erysipelotrichaceae bacterium]
MNQKQLNIMNENDGFIAALDQSGGSTPKALLSYGVDDSYYNNEDEMFNEVHKMRSRIIQSPSFNNKSILAAILFENTIDKEIENKLTADYLWEEKGIVPFLKIDQGLDLEKNGVQLMKTIDGLTELLQKAKQRNIFGTKMRSLIKKADPVGIKAIVDQQFEIAQIIIQAGLVPIIEPEVDINIPDKLEAEALLKNELHKKIKTLKAEDRIIFKLTIPTKANFYQELMIYPQVIRVVALSGGYSAKKANQLLALNHNLIASFSRALAEGLSYQKTQEEFDQTLENSIKNIYQASIT